MAAATGRQVPGSVADRQPAPAAGAATAGRSQRTADQAAETVRRTARWLRRRVPELTARLAAGTGRVAVDAVHHPDHMLMRGRALRRTVPVLRQAVAPILTGRVADWRAEYAYTVGVQAFVYGFPYIHNAQLRHEWVTHPRDPGVVPYAAVGQFWHATRLIDATYRDGGSPNNDTLYSVAWLDLRDGPVVLSHPDMGERYFAFQIVAFTSDTADYVGQRTTGSGAGHFAITGPGWDGELPQGVRATAAAPTPWVLVLGRTAVDGPDDVPHVRALQEQYRLTALHQWGRADAGGSAADRRDVYAPAPPGKDPLGPWRTLNAMLAENPPPAHHALLLEQFAEIGIGPGVDVASQPASVQQGLIRAATIGMPLLRRQFASGDWATVVNGWRYPPAEIGRFGDHFLRRAADQSLAGIAANDPAEAVYLVSFSDVDDTPLAAGARYELRCAADCLPPVDAFWSLTAYTSDDMNLIPNEAGRYSVGDRTPGLRRDPDGTLTLHLQPDPPEQNRMANWLPTSAEHPWFVILRLYRPGPQVITGDWRCPGLRRIQDNPLRTHPPILASRPAAQEAPMTSPAKLPPDNAGAALMRFDGLRGHRYGEIILFGRDTESGNQLGSIYNTVGLNDFVGTGDTCPQQLWDNIDPDKLAAEYAVLGAYKNGPRLWCLDWVECMAGAERDFQGVKARWVMWLDVSKELREHESFPYKPVTGRRDTKFGIGKGSPAFILDDPEGNSWVMKSVSLIADPARTYEQLADLGERLQPPPGWRYRTVVLDADLVLTPDNGTARITQDDLGNVYDRAGGPFSNYNP